MPHHLGGLVVHGDRPLGVAQSDTGRKVRIFGKQRCQRSLITMQNHIHRGMLGH